MRINFCIIIILLLSLVSCKKYLEERPSSQLYVPESIDDLQALLDQNSTINFQAASSLIESVADDYFVLDQRYESMSPDLRAAYIWEDARVQFQDGWLLPYRIIYTCNVVLDNLSKVNANVLSQRNNIEGSALFYRSLSFYYLLQLYSKPYSSSAETDLGIIIRTSPSITQYEPRSSVKVCYDKIIADLEKGLTLLPLKATNLMRPSQTAIKALLARIYLSMSDFANAEKYAEQAINDNPKLLDYNDLIPVSTPLLPNFLENKEIIFFTTLQTNSLNSPIASIIDTSLIFQYDENDLRKPIFFVETPFGGAPGRYRFIGSYYTNANSTVFFGLTTDEMHFILAECKARRGDLDNSLNIINSLLRNRYRTGKYVDYISSNQDEIVKFILRERRKGLIFRGLRWTDVRRLNLMGANIELKRLVKGSIYILSPNSLRSVLLIPETEISRSGIQQNPR